MLDIPYAPQAGAVLIYGPAADEGGVRGVIVSILVTAVGTTSAVIYDNATGAASGTIIGEILSTATVGQVISMEMAFNHGVTVSGATTAPAFTCSIDNQN